MQVLHHASVNPRNITIAVQDRNAAEVTRLGGILEDVGYRVLPATLDAQVERYATTEPLNLVVKGFEASRDVPIAFMQHIRSLSPDTEFVLCVEGGTLAGSVKALRAGARDYLAQPVTPEALCAAVRYALERQALVAEDPKLRRSLKRLEEPDIFVGTSRRMREVGELVAEVASAVVPVLVTGESGTGKELVARAVHERSGRRGPFVAINCAGLPDNLIESELFGHVRGAFTGAITDRKGAFELAGGGTLFLDEIGDLSAKGQGDLLRVLEDGIFRPIGGTRPLRANVRIVAATNRNLHQSVAVGRFRDDLLYRLNIVELHLPPLRERPEDIPALVDSFNRHFSARHGRKEKQFDAAFMEALRQHRWPGNIRQLRNLIERLVVTVRSTSIGAAHAPPFAAPDASSDREVLFQVRAGESLPELEARLIRATLEKVTRNRRDGARVLGLSPRTLAYRIKALGLSTAKPLPPD